MQLLTSHPDLQIIENHIFSNISQSKDNQTMIFDQLIEHSKRINFYQSNGKNETQ